MGKREEMIMTYKVTLRRHEMVACRICANSGWDWLTNMLPAVSWQVKQLNYQATKHYRWHSLSATDNASAALQIMASLLH